MKLEQMPSIINIEVFRGECPCKCVHCPVGIKNSDDRKKYYSIKHMELDLFKKICDELCLMKAGTLRIHSVGEPLLWNCLLDAIRYTKEKGVTTWLFTSLVTSDRDLLKELCENVSIIEVSVNSIEEKDYRLTKGIDAFSLVSENIRFMADYIKEHQLDTRLVVSRVQSESFQLDEEFVKTWKENGLVEDAFVRTYHTYNSILEDMPQKKNMTKIPCNVHWKRFNISVDGLAVVCFNELFKKDLSKECIVGNINKQTIYDVWHSIRMQEIRAADAENYFPREKFSCEFPCASCLNCQTSHGKVTSEYQIEQLRISKRS